MLLLIGNFTNLLRSEQEHPEVHRLEDLAIRSGVDELMTSRDLYDVFRSHDRVHWDERTNLYRYKVRTNSHILLSH